MPDYNIHIHLPRDEQRQQETAVESIIRRVGRCVDWKSLYALGKEFPKLGLAIAETAENIILCRLVEGRPITEHILDDYVFLGSKNDLNGIISPRHVEVITTFIAENHGPAQKMQPPSGKIHHYANSPPAIYGKPIMICNESTLCESQSIEAIARKLL